MVSGFNYSDPIPPYTPTCRTSPQYWLFSSYIILKLCIYIVLYNRSVKQVTIESSLALGRTLVTYINKERTTATGVTFPERAQLIDNCVLLFLLLLFILPFVLAFLLSLSALPFLFVAYFLFLKLCFSFCFIRLRGNQDIRKSSTYSAIHWRSEAQSRLMLVYNIALPRLLYLFQLLFSYIYRIYVPKKLVA